MFIMFEEDGVRAVYDLKNFVRFEEKDGNISAFKINDEEIFSNKNVNKACFRPDDDVRHVAHWLLGMSHADYSAMLGREADLEEKE